MAYKRVTIKVGSNVITRDDDHVLDVARLASLVDQIARLRRAGVEVVLVSSGAVSSGKGVLRNFPLPPLDEVEERQLFSAVGQTKLLQRYYDFFHEYNIPVGQVLTMKENFADGLHRDNQQRCITAMLRAGILPIVNENDTVSITELMFTDNDELSGLVAQMVGAEALVILSNVDGLYGDDGDVIAEVGPGEDVCRYIKTKKSNEGRGGMQSKCSTARAVADSGIDVLIANGRRPGVLLDLVLDEGKTTHTKFTRRTK